MPVQLVAQNLNNTSAGKSPRPGAPSPIFFMLRIPLTNGKFASVNDSDFGVLHRYRWSAEKIGRTWYAVRRENGKKVYMHRQIMGFPPKPFEVHHDDHDGLNNRRRNLLVATKGQQAANAFKKVPVTGYRGVAKNHKRFAAKIRVGCKWKYIGTFNTPEEAALAYDQAAINQWGRFAAPNFPEEKG